jgi:hypothetical protein
MTKIHIRPAETRDIPVITALLLGDAAKRASLAPSLWAVAPDAPARIVASLQTIAEAVTGPLRHHWTVAEQGGVIVAVTHAANVPAPPIIDLQGGTAGILLDDSHLAADGAVSRRLIEETERRLAEAGAVLFVAASPSNWRERTDCFAAIGYEPTTLYMAKTGLNATYPGDVVRLATAADVDGIVHLSALHRARLKVANPVFWAIHAQADARFKAWMAASLTMTDRSIYVSDGPDMPDAFIIAQPASPLHFQPANDITKIGLIDDFYASAFEGADDAKDAAPKALVAAAEARFHDQGIDTALAICPVRMTAKADLLTECGYKPANLWMVKTRQRA